MHSKDIRRAFIDFFKGKEHHHIPAVPIVAHNHPSLLFVNAGMNPFASLLVGLEQPRFGRVVNSQPCLRVTGKHNDLEEVGHDTYHHTLFEMLGNWSFGDYARKEAIAWGWELLTQVYGLPAERLYVTVFAGDEPDKLSADDDSRRLWADYLAPHHIMAGSKADNFWEMGATGPCGPCTEIHVDVRSEQERARVPAQKLVNTGHPHVIELWNMVFVTYERLVNGTLVKLAKQHVDTGMGLERLVMVLQGKQSTYDTDLFTALRTSLEQRTGYVYGREKRKDHAMRVVMDHMRAAVFAIADGAPPATQKSGYVVRRILRRAIRYAYSYLGMKEPFIHTMVPTVASMYAGVYPSVHNDVAGVQHVIQHEEKGFLRTLAGGIKRFTMMVDTLPAGGCIKGEAVFELYDTFGFPPDLTRVMAQEQGYHIDETGFTQAMAQQKARGKQAVGQPLGNWVPVHVSTPHSVFVGYDTLRVQTKVVKYRRIQKGEALLYQVVLHTTPFYAEGGGQVGDRGQLVWGDVHVDVLDTQKEYGAIVHYVRDLPSAIAEDCIGIVDEKKRKSTQRNHTAAHLLGAALRNVLGPHTLQKGSLVDDKVCRLDFAHGAKLTKEELAAVTNIVNAKIRENVSLKEQRHVPMAEAQAMGAVAVFHEKYDEDVRVVTFDPAFSMELCGGTHVQATGEIGLMHIMKESSSSAGVRRIEAVTGEVAQSHLAHLQDQLRTISTLLRHQEPVQGVQTLVEQHKLLRKRVEGLAQKAFQTWQDQLAAECSQAGDILVREVHIDDVSMMKKVVFALIKQSPKRLIALGTVLKGRAYLMIGVGADRLGRYKASELAHEVSDAIDGKVAGKPAFAMVNGTHTAGLQEALAKARASIALPEQAQH